VRVNVRFLLHTPRTVLFPFTSTSRVASVIARPSGGKSTVAITGKIERRSSTRRARRSTVAPRRAQRAGGYESYLGGRFYGPRRMEQAQRISEQAGRIAPDWAPPMSAWPPTDTSLPFFNRRLRPHRYAKRGGVGQALSLDETLAEAHAANASNPGVL